MLLDIFHYKNISLLLPVWRFAAKVLRTIFLLVTLWSPCLVLTWLRDVLGKRLESSPAVPKLKESRILAVAKPTTPLSLLVTVATIFPRFETQNGPQESDQIGAYLRLGNSSECLDSARLMVVAGKCLERYRLPHASHQTELCNLISHGTVTPGIGRYPVKSIRNISQLPSSGVPTRIIRHKSKSYALSL